MSRNHSAPLPAFAEPGPQEAVRREFRRFRHHLLLDLGHHRRLHRLDIRQAHELARFDRRAVDLDRDFHRRSLAWGPDARSSIQLSPAVDPGRRLRANQADVIFLAGVRLDLS
jgi:hypothetical protein